MMTVVASDLMSSTFRPQSTLVGRAAELELLGRLVGPSSPDSPARHALLSGDAGIGKTRLLTALAEVAQSSGRLVAVGHCLDFGDASLPYLPFTEIFGQLQARFPDEMTEIAQHHRGIRRLLPAERGLPDDHGLSDEAATAESHVARTELYDAVARAFDQMADHASGLLIIIEDLHWSDPSSRHLLTYLLSRQFEHSVALVASYRHDDLTRTHPLRPVLANWSRLEQLERIDLHPLPPADLRTLVLGLRPDLALHELATVIERSEGNAFFAEELAAAAAADGVLPADLAELLLLRLDVLSESARRIVRVASVAGRTVGHDLLARVADLPEDELDSALRSAVEHRILIGRNSGYAFRHALLAEAVYNDLLPGERVRFHARFVDALCGSDVRGTAAELARHARASHDNRTALIASIEAGEEASRVGGPDDALHHYRNALQLAEQQPILDSEAGEVEQLRALVELTIKASEAAEAAGHLDQAINLLRDRLTLFPEDPVTASETGPIRAALLQALAAALLYSDYELDERNLLAEAVDLIDRTRDRELYAKLLATKALSYYGRARYPDAVDAAQRATNVANELGLQRVVNAQTILLAKIKQRLGDPETSIHETADALDSAIRHGDVNAEVRATDQLGAIYFEQGRLTDAMRSYLEAAQRASRIGRRWSPYGLDAVVMAAQTAFTLGDWDRCLELSSEGQQVPDLARANLDLGILAVRAGRGESEALKILPSLRRWWAYDSMVTINCCPGIELYAEIGDHQAAFELHDQMLGSIRTTYGKAFIGQLRLSGVLLGALTSAADTYDDDQLSRRGSDSLAAARESMTEFLKLRTPGPEAYAWQARVEAEYLRLQQRLGGPVSAEDLVAAWELTVQRFTRYPHVYELARSRTRLAAALMVDGKDDQRVQKLIIDARSVAEQLRAGPLLAEINRLDRLRSARSAAGANHPLTAREREVLDLVADGLSNRDIGNQLVISTKTASVHVSNILAKLHAGSRTEAVAIARRDGWLT